VITSSVDESQRKAASVVGFTYLFAMAVSIFAEGYVGGHLIVPGNATETARNIMSNERLFRLGIAGSLIIVVSDVALIAALYVILKRVNEHLALFAAFLRLMGTAIYAAATLNYIDVLRLLSGAGYLQALSTDQLQALARLSIASYSAGLGVAFVYLGLGSTVFGYLWVKSNYIPRALSILGVIASFLLAAGAFTFILFPKLWVVIFPGYMVPMFFFEVGTGLWLLVKGLRHPRQPSPKAGSSAFAGSSADRTAERR
jgi:hypothetical protein